MQFLGEARLYTDHDFFQKNFSWPANNDRVRALKYHCFWSGQTSHHHLLSLKSLLISQSQPFEVWIWMPAGDMDSNGDVIQAFKGNPCVRIREYRVETEAANAPYLQYLDLLKGGSDPSPVAKSDAFRLLILAKYGGIYFDLDVLFLKDLRPFSNVEFFYQWSKEPYANNAVIHAFEQSSSMQTLLERGSNLGTYYPTRLLNFNELANSLEETFVFPSFLFDPAWISNDLRMRQNSYCNVFDDFFMNESPITIAEFFPHSCAYHWHNRWDWPIREKSIVGQLYEEISAKYTEISEWA